MREDDLQNTQHISGGLVDLSLHLTELLRSLSGIVTEHQHSMALLEGTELKVKTKELGRRALEATQKFMEDMGSTSV